MPTSARPLIARDLVHADWFKSSYSGNGNNCVEVADLLTSPYRAIAIRDSKDPNGPALRVSPAGWASFVTAVADGELPST
ncbi:hypothetical protein SBI_06536 [Streptomyces bingchenggensis BCW-1]|uniref:DUF397 domain-containing protein n=1 Tax=Streptomyces bingchenggensis (strain BCW-1) TaxID=749414 RepID=D7BVS7_STRBB|nr:MULTISPECIES: DUF397 domain-containing protein [Streptomyces]ADI09656.1 hypothetical protein SBI_06536 [Streptomyces bingchenggensis BCW-1]